jgi:hypothetical protein
MHGGNTRPAELDESTGLLGSRSGASSRSRSARSLVARAILATLTAVRGGVTTVSVHGAARALSPVTTDSVAELGTAASVGSGDTGGLCADHARGLTKNGLASAGDRRWASIISRGRSSSSSRGAVLAAVLATIGDEAVTIGRTAVSEITCETDQMLISKTNLPVRRTASAVSAVGITGSVTKVLTTATIISGSSGTSCRLSRSGRLSRGGRGAVVAAGQTSSTTVGWGVSTPPVGRTARSGVDGAVRVAEKVPVGRTTLSVSGVLSTSLSLRSWEAKRRARPGRDLGEFTLEVGRTASHD